MLFWILNKKGRELREDVARKGMGVPPRPSKLSEAGRAGPPIAPLKLSSQGKDTIFNLQQQANVCQINACQITLPNQRLS